jgi:hypothetical protein
MQKCLKCGSKLLIPLGNETLTIPPTNLPWFSTTEAIQCEMESCLCLDCGFIECGVSREQLNPLKFAALQKTMNP